MVSGEVSWEEMLLKSKPSLMSRGKLKGIFIRNFSRFRFLFESKSRYGFLDKKGKQHDGLYKNGFHDAV